jgi:hypothetical protein
MRKALKLLSVFFAVILTFNVHYPVLSGIGEGV